jgi:hypothetical protein
MHDFFPKTVIFDSYNRSIFSELRYNGALIFQIDFANIINTI